MLFITDDNHLVNVAHIAAVVNVGGSTEVHLVGGSSMILDLPYPDTIRALTSIQDDI